MPRKKYAPHPYQGIMIDHSIDVPRGMRCVFMGAGKTVATLTALEYLYMMGIETEPTLVMAPKRVAQSTWPDEALAWDHLRNIEVQPIIGTAEERIKALRNSNASVFTINYENIPWLCEHLGEGNWPWPIVIADESTKLKSWRGQMRWSKKDRQYVQADGAIRMRGFAKVAHSKVRIISELTGTPAPNGLQDIWGQMWFVDAGERLGRTYGGFEQRWFTVNEYTREIAPHGHSGREIQDRIRDVCLALRAEDWFPVERPKPIPVMFDLPPAVRDLYRKMEKEFVFTVDGKTVVAPNAAAKSIKLLQLCNGAVYLDPSVEDDDDPKAILFKEVHDLKTQALESILAEAGGEPVIVAYHFKSDLARLRKAFPRGRELDDDPKTIRDWNAGKIPILFLHPASAGHGLNLQHPCRRIVFYGLWWNLEEHLQAIERIGPVRQLQSGYNRVVFVYYIMARDAADETVVSRLALKTSVQDAFTDAMRGRRDNSEMVAMLEHIFDPMPDPIFDI